MRESHVEAKNELKQQVKFLESEQRLQITMMDAKRGRPVEIKNGLSETTNKTIEKVAAILNFVIIVVLISQQRDTMKTDV